MERNLAVFLRFDEIFPSRIRMDFFILAVAAVNTYITFVDFSTRNPSLRQEI